jgi:hypothetical protein
MHTIALDKLRREQEKHAKRIRKEKRKWLNQGISIPFR